MQEHDYADKSECRPVSDKDGVELDGTEMSADQSDPLRPRWLVNAIRRTGNRELTKIRNLVQTLAEGVMLKIQGNGASIVTVPYMYRIARAEVIMAANHKNTSIPILTYLGLRDPMAATDHLKVLFAITYLIDMIDEKIKGVLRTPARKEKMATTLKVTPSKITPVLPSKQNKRKKTPKPSGKVIKMSDVRPGTVWQMQLDDSSNN